jgi:putative ABC transport system ATP-binding protein
VIEARNIEKSYGNEKVLKGVSLKISPGEFVSIMGESGSGKSTLISILGGFLQPDGGEVLWSSEPVSSMNEKRMAELRATEMGFVFQSYCLIPTLNVNDNLLLPLTLGKKVSKELLSYGENLLDLLKLSDMVKKFPHQLSGGQCQRVAIARSLIYRPKVIILDEPTGALDSEMEEVVMELLRRVNREDGTTVIQVTHSMKVACYASRIIRLADGEITAEEVVK